MSFSTAIAIVFFAVMPILGPDGTFWLLGFLVLPYLAGRWVYNRFKGPWWVLAALPMPAVWFGFMYLVVLAEIALEQ